MLMRPPKINEQYENNSHIHTQSDDKHQSRSKNKNKIKQSSLSLKKNNSSKKSNDQYQRDRKDTDNASVNSHGSGRSKKSKKKQASIGSVRYNVVLPINTYQTNNSHLSQDFGIMSQIEPPKNPTNIEQVQIQKINDNKLTTNTYDNKKPSSFKDVLKNQFTTSKQNHNPRKVDEEVTVVKLQQKKNTNTNRFTQDIDNKLIGPKIAQKKQTKKLGQIFEQNRKNSHNQLPIPNPPSQQNTNSIISQSRKSKSKLGQLFKQNNLQKQSNKQQSSYHQSQPSNSKNRDKLTTNKKQIPPKMLDQSVNQFQEGDDFNKEDLNLSMSKNSPFNSKLGQNAMSYDRNSKDSLCFVIQPQRKKGLQVTSKTIKDSDELIKIPGNLISKDLNEIHKGKNANAHERVKANIKQNEKCLIQSGALNSQPRSNFKEEVPTAKQQQLKRKQEEVNKKLRQLQRQQNMISERNNQQKNRIEQQKKMHKKKQQELRAKQQQWKRKQQIRKEQDRVREEERINQDKKRMEYKKKIEEDDRQRKMQAQQQQQQQRRKEAQSRSRWEQQNEKIRVERQKLKSQFSRSKQQLQYTNSLKGKSKSIIQTLQQLDSNTNTYDKKTRQQTHEIGSLKSQTQWHQNSQKGSNKSSISKKSNRKKQTSIPLKTKNAKLYGDMSPRGQASFYQQSNHQIQKQQSDNKKHQQLIPRNLISFSQNEQQQAKVQYKTDTYFYNKNSRVPPAPPSSKPPISKKSIDSSSKNKKQSSIQRKKKNNMHVIQINNKSQKKLSVLEQAMRKNYQGSGSQYQSQDSYRSREVSVSSSKKSNGSKGSYKKQSVIPKKQKKYQRDNNEFDIPQVLQDNEINQRKIQRQNKIYQKTYSRKSGGSRQRQEPCERRIIKDCCFIDDKGRLVENGDLVVSGPKVSSTSDLQYTSKKLTQRLLNSRNQRKSRSRQRSLNRSRASSRSLQRIQTNNSRQNNSKFVQSQAYSETQHNSKSNSNFYNSGYQTNDDRGMKGNFKCSNYRPAPPQVLQQFIKPIQYENMIRPQQHNPKEKSPPKQAAQKKKSMRRTQKCQKKYQT